MAISKIQDAGVSLTGAALPAGSVLQVVSTTKTDTWTSQSSSWVDVTGLTASITPSSTSSKILVMASVAVGLNPVYFQMIRLARGGSPIAQGDVDGARLQTGGMLYIYNQLNPANSQITWPCSLLDSPNSVSSLTYSVQMEQIDAQTMYVNRLSRDDNAAYEPRSVSAITLMEIAG